MSDFTPAPKLQWRDDAVPVSEHFGDVYFSKDNGLEETRYVFLGGNRLFQSSDDNPTKNARLIIGETGFGTGLNFLATWQAWKNAQTQPLLHYISVEKYPLSKDQLAKALSAWPELNHFAGALIAQYPDPMLEPAVRCVFEGGRVQLTLLFADATAAYQQLASQTVAESQADFGAPVRVDAWYLDGFAPAKNPDMWCPELFTAMAALSHRHTTLATFTAAGFVRRGLQSAGFQIEKRKGFGCKREMLVGNFKPLTASENASQPDESSAIKKKPLKGPLPRIPHWTRVRSSHRVKSIAIIGAGLAGCHTARSLANRGISVTLFEQHSIASGASGNPQGVVYTRPSHHDDIFARFNALALDFADAFYREFAPFYAATGVVHLGFDEKHQLLNQQVLDRFEHFPAIASPVTNAEINRQFGACLDYDGIYSQKGGSISPPQLCRALVDHPLISLIENTSIDHFNYQPSEDWYLSNVDRYFDAVVIANAHQAVGFDSVKSIHLNPIRGQMNSLLMKRPAPVNTSLCSEGYVAPSVAVDSGWRLSFGATFTLKQNPNDEATLLPSKECTANNLNTLRGLLGSDYVTDALKEGLLESRVSYRCATRDYLPLVGPVAEAHSFIEQFAKYRKNKNARIDATCPVYPDLYINVGHGSRGLAYTPICAELLASLICGEPLPMADMLYPHLHPARFYVRDLTRNKL